MVKENKKIVILYSGGLDSFVMMKLAQSKNLDIILCHYDIGQAYSKKELKAIKSCNHLVQIKKVDWLNQNQDLFSKKDNNCGSIFIPGRNMVLASLAASTFLPDEVWIGGLKGEDNIKATDKNKTFVDKTNELWSYVYSPFSVVPKLVFPLVNQNWGKFEAVEWLYKNNIASKEEILQTSSCLNDTKEKNCGVCIVCCRRKYIFKQLGFEEEYEQDPLSNKDNLKMIIEMLEDTNEPNDPNEPQDLTKFIHYDSFRKKEILPGLYLEFKTQNHLELIKIMEDKLKNLDNLN